MASTPIALRYTDMTNGSQLSNVYPLAINCTSSGNNILIPAVNDKQILIFRIFFVTQNSTVVILRDGASTNLTGPIRLADGGSFVLDLSALPWFQTSYGNAFVLNSSAPVQISGTVYYQQKS